jgi:LPS-assembly lipoprotein
MWWLDERHRRGFARAAALAALLAAAASAGGCWQPLYATRPTAAAESVHDQLASVDVVPIRAPQGSPAERIAVGLHNALQFDLNGGAGGTAPTHRLEVNVGTSQITVVIDHATGRPEAQIANVVANYKLVEIATGKTVVRDSYYAHVDYDIPGTEQRFAKQRAHRDAEDRAIQMAAEAIRNRLASYFVAGT